MAKLGAIAPAKQAQTPAAEIESDLELVPSLFTDATGSRNTQFRARAHGGAIRSRVYVTDGRPAEKLAGEILSGTVNDITFVQTKKYDDGNVATKIEFRDTMQEGVLVVLWGPEDYDFDSLKITL